MKVSFSNQGTMFFEKGWKTFLRSRNISRGDTIVFKFDGEDTLSARIFDSDGDRACCCMESSSDEELLSEEEASTEDEADSEEDV